MLPCRSQNWFSDSWQIPTRFLRFLRDVKVAPDPQCVLFFNWQLEDMERFLTREEFGIFTADTTYNLGKFYVTPSTYRHLMLEDVSTRKHPTHKFLAVMPIFEVLQMPSEGHLSFLLGYVEEACGQRLG